MRFVSSPTHNLQFVSDVEDENARLMGNPGVPPPQKISFKKRVFLCGLCGSLAITFLSGLVNLIFLMLDTRVAIDLCPPVNVSNTTTVTLNISSLCNPITDAQRFQDVIDADRFGFIMSDTNGITCDITWQDSNRKFNESCTLVTLEMIQNETTIDLMLGNCRVPRVRLDAIEWNSLGREETFTWNILTLFGAFIAFMSLFIQCFKRGL